MSKSLDSIQAWDVRPLSQAYRMSSPPFPSNDHTVTQRLTVPKQEANTGATHSGTTLIHENTMKNKPKNCHLFSFSMFIKG